MFGGRHLPLLGFLVGSRLTLREVGIKRVTSALRLRSWGLASMVVLCFSSPGAGRGIKLGGADSTGGAVRGSARGLGGRPGGGPGGSTRPRRGGGGMDGGGRDGGGIEGGGGKLGGGCRNIIGMGGGTASRWLFST